MTWMKGVLAALEVACTQKLTTTTRQPRMPSAAWRSDWQRWRCKRTADRA